MQDRLAIHHCAIDSDTSEGGSLPSGNHSAAAEHFGSRAWQVLPALDVLAPGAICGADQVPRIHGLTHAGCRWPLVGEGPASRHPFPAVESA